MYFVFNRFFDIIFIFFLFYLPIDKLLRKTNRKFLFVFNDVLVITVKKDNSDQYEVQETYYVKDLRLRYTTLSDQQEEKYAFELIVSRGRNRPRVTMLFTCDNENAWKQWTYDLENTLLAYHRQTEYAKILGWFHDIIQGNIYSAAYLGDIVALKQHVKLLTSNNNNNNNTGTASANTSAKVSGSGSGPGSTRENPLDKLDLTGMTALHWTALRGHEICVRFLLDRGAEVDVLQKGLNSPLLLAATGGHETVARLLLERGADLRCKNHKGHDAVFMAVLYGHAAKGLPWLLQLLTHRGLDLNQQDACGATPLHLCAEKNLARPVRMLVDAGMFGYHIY
jgi:hypothetical protein